MESISVLYYHMGGGTYHKVIKYTNSNGNISLLEAGPQDKLTGLFMGPIVKYPERNYTSINNFTEDPMYANSPTEILLTGSDLSDKWKLINRGMDVISNGSTSYFLLGMNSNYAADFALLYAGLDAPGWDVLDYYCPGSINIENGALLGAPDDDAGFVPISNMRDISALGIKSLLILLGAVS